MIIWRFGRFVALTDGVDSFEMLGLVVSVLKVQGALRWRTSVGPLIINDLRNMLGCVSFNYTFVEFWRIWHASMNEFMLRPFGVQLKTTEYLRYLYWPLGGKHRAWLAVPVVFLFVGFWHERTGACWCKSKRYVTMISVCKDTLS